MKKLIFGLAAIRLRYVAKLNILRALIALTVLEFLGKGGRYE